MILNGAPPVMWWTRQAGGTWTNNDIFVTPRQLLAEDKAESCKSVAQQRNPG
jgi:hypothetical protein